MGERLTPSGRAMVAPGWVSRARACPTCSWVIAEGRPRALAAAEPASAPLAVPLPIKPRLVGPGGHREPVAGQRAYAPMETPNSASMILNMGSQVFHSVLVWTAMVCRPSGVPDREEPGSPEAAADAAQRPAARRLLVELEQAEAVAGVRHPVTTLGGDRGPHLPVLGGRQQAAAGHRADEADHVAGGGDDIAGRPGRGGS